MSTIATELEERTKTPEDRVIKQENLYQGARLNPNQVSSNMCAAGLQNCYRNMTSLCLVPLPFQRSFYRS